MGQAAELVAWAMAWPERTWAVEGASGRGHLLAQLVPGVLIGVCLAGAALVFRSCGGQ